MWIHENPGHSLVNTQNSQSLCLHTSTNVKTSRDHLDEKNYEALILKSSNHYIPPMFQKYLSSQLWTESSDHLLIRQKMAGVIKAITVSATWPPQPDNAWACSANQHSCVGWLVPRGCPLLTCNIPAECRFYRPLGLKRSSFPTASSWHNRKTIKLVTNR